MNSSSLVKVASSIQFDDRVARLMKYSEPELHKLLLKLFSEIQRDDQVFITHGVNELGKDLIIVKPDRITSYITGVIVKKGELSGASHGDIDEIKERADLFKKLSNKAYGEIRSQVVQAGFHQDIIPGTATDFRIDKILLVIAGTITRNAVTRLKELTSQGIVVLDIKWLIDNFTEYYPQVFFDAEVCDYVSKCIAEIEQEHWLAKNDVPLSKYYVEPTITKYKFELEITDKALDDVFKNRTMDFNEISDLITNKKSALIVGEPGSGKTGMLSRLTLSYLSFASEKLTISDNGLIHLPTYIRATSLDLVTSIDELRSSIPLEVKERVITNALLVDALDELPSAKRLEVLDKARHFAEELSCALVVTSRNIRCLHDIDHGFEKYEIQPFNLSQALTMLSKLFQDDPNKLSVVSAMSKELYNQIQFAPLSLLLLIELVEDHQEIPASITELYQRFFDMIFGRWDKEKGLDEVFDYIVVYDYISKLAHDCFFCNQKLEITLEEFNNFNKEYCYNKEYESEYFNKLVCVVERAGVLRVDNHVYFMHRTFLDYFSALYITKNKEYYPDVTNTIGLLYYDDVWSDIAFYYVGHDRVLKKPLLDSVLSRADDSFSVMLCKLELGRLLQAGWNSDRSIKEEAIRIAARYAKVCRDKLYQLSDIKKYDTIFNDYLVLFVADMSLGSIVISRTVVNILNEMPERISSDNYYEYLALLWAAYKHLTESQLSVHVKTLLDVVPSLSIPQKELINLYRFLETISKHDLEHHAKIEKQLVSIFESSKEVQRRFIEKKSRKHTR